MWTVTGIIVAARNKRDKLVRAPPSKSQCTVVCAMSPMRARCARAFSYQAQSEIGSGNTVHFHAIRRGRPPTRTCHGDSTVPYWSTPRPSCSGASRPPTWKGTSHDYRASAQYAIELDSVEAYPTLVAFVQGEVTVSDTSGATPSA